MITNKADMNDKLKYENIELKKEVKRLKEEATSIDEGWYRFHKEEIAFYNKEWYRFHMERKRELEKFLTPKRADEIFTLKRDNALDTL